PKWQSLQRIVLQSGDEAGFVTHAAGGVMIRMAAFPIWNDHGVRLEFPDYFSDRDLVRLAIFKMSVGEAEIPPDFHAQYFGGACRFLQPRFRRTARAGFAACQIQN